MGLAGVKAQVVPLTPPSAETSRMNSFLVQYLLPKEPLLEVRSRGVCVVCEVGGSVCRPELKCRC